MRESGSHEAAGTVPESQKRVAGSRLPPLSVPPTPQTMLQDRRLGLPAPLPNPSSGRGLNPIGSGRGMEDWGTRSSRTLSSGAGVVRRRMTAGSGLEPLPLQPPRRPAAGSGAGPGFGGPAGTANVSGLSASASAPLLSAQVGPSGLRRPKGMPLDGPATSVPGHAGTANPVFSLSSALKNEVTARAAAQGRQPFSGAPANTSKPLHDPGCRSMQFSLGHRGLSDKQHSEQAKHAKHPPNGGGQFGSRPHGLPLRRVEASDALLDPSAPVFDASCSPLASPHCIAATHGETKSMGSSEGSLEYSKATAGSDLKVDLNLMPFPAKGFASDPKYAAKCVAVANLQRLFFEEVGRSGDANAAAATALLRLAEESRPAMELSPGC